MSPETVLFLQLVVSGIAIGGIYALVALGFVLIYKSTDVLNMAQGEMLMIGAWFSYSLIVDYRIPFIPAFLLTLVFSLVLGLAIERAALRPLIGQPVISVIMVTIGLSIFLRAVVIAIWGTQYQRYPTPIQDSVVNLGPIPVAEVYVWSLVVCLLLVGGLTLGFRFTRMGIAMRAVADDQQAALSVGISVRRVFATAWVISAVVSSIGGILLANIQGVGIGLSAVGLKALPVSIVGGLDSIPGAIIGGILIGVLENLSAGYLDVPLGGGVREVVPYVFLVLILLIKPYGLFGKERIERV
jgi:branched-chain amino acid transport system permease protein